MLFLIRINMPSQQSHRLTTQRTRPQGTLVSKGHSSLGSSWWDVKFTGVLLRTNWGYASKTPNCTIVSLQNTGVERGLGARIFFKRGNQGPKKERDCPRSPNRWYPNYDKNAALDSVCDEDTASIPGAVVLKLRIRKNHPESSSKISILRTHPSAILSPESWFGTQN